MGHGSGSAIGADDGIAKIYTDQPSVKEVSKKKYNPDSAIADHPQDLETFWRQNPNFIWGPCVVAAVVAGVTAIPTVSAFLAEKGMEPYGFYNALHYTVYSIVLSYAFHAFVILHVSDNLKLQDGNEYNMRPNAMAARSTAAMCTQLVYSVFPMAPASSSWLMFWGWTAVFAVFWDAWFYAAHRYAHEVPWAYKFFHKMHHLNKHPNCFGAYFVTYQSHILLEQAVVLVGCLAGLPRDVFNFYMYYGVLGTFIEHCGYELGSMKLPLVPITFGMLSSALSFYAVGMLEGVNSAEHDWHHEKFTTNYSLSFKYLDKIFGTYHEGRKPGPTPAKDE